MLRRNGIWKRMSRHNATSPGRGTSWPGQLCPARGQWEGGRGKRGASGGGKFNKNPEIDTSLLEKMLLLQLGFELDCGSMRICMCVCVRVYVCVGGLHSANGSMTKVRWSVVQTMAKRHKQMDIHMWNIFEICITLVLRLLFLFPPRYTYSNFYSHSLSALSHGFFVKIFAWMRPVLAKC